MRALHGLPFLPKGEESASGGEQISVKTLTLGAGFDDYIVLAFSFQPVLEEEGNRR